MRQSRFAVRMWGACLTLWLCSGCGSDSESSGPNGASPGGGGRFWVATRGIQELLAVDANTGHVDIELEVATDSVEVSALAVASRQAFVGRSDGALLVFDEAREEVEKTLNIASSGERVELVAVGGGSVYAASGSPNDPQVQRVDLASGTVQAAAPVIGGADLFSGLVYDSGTLWVLSDNNFKLSKVDAASLAVLGSVSLGQDPSEPQGARGDFYGSGLMAEMSDKLWIIDVSAAQLLSVEKGSLTAKYESDLSDLLEPEGGVALAVNHDSFFVTLPDAGKIVRFDGASGARAQTYTLETGAGLAIAASNDRLYVNKNVAGWDVSEVDIRSGMTTNTYVNLRPAWLAIE